MLGVACLVDLLGEQERLLVLVLRREYQAGELARHPFFPHEERRQTPQHLLAQILRQSLPVTPVLGKVDLV